MRDKRGEGREGRERRRERESATKGESERILFHNSYTRSC